MYGYNKMQLLICCSNERRRGRRNDEVKIMVHIETKNEVTNKQTQRFVSWKREWHGALAYGWTHINGKQYISTPGNRTFHIHHQPLPRHAAEQWQSLPPISYIVHKFRSEATAVVTASYSHFNLAPFHLANSGFFAEQIPIPPSKYVKWNSFGTL